MMISLFDQTLLFGMYTLSFLALATLEYMIYRNKSPKQRAVHAAISLGVAFTFSFILWWIIQTQFPEDAIPFDLVIWSLPLSLSLWALVNVIRVPKRIALATLSIITSLLLALLIVNDYYHYYPTIASIINTSTTTVAVASPADSNVKLPNSVVFEQFFLPLPLQPKNGVMKPLNIPSSSANFTPRQGRIYLPPAALHNTQIQLPVIILLSGLPGSPLQWEQSGIQAIMDNFAAQHKGLSPVVAMVDFAGVKDQDTECVNSPRGDVETYLTKDVPTYLKNNFPIQTKPQYWAIGGYSAGGTCGPLIALRNPNVYRNYFNISGDAEPSIGSASDTLATLFSGSKEALRQHTIADILTTHNPVFQSMNAWYYIGEQDMPNRILDMKKQVAEAKRAGIKTRFTQIPGEHTFFVWKQGYIDGLPWLSHQMGLTTYNHA